MGITYPISTKRNRTKKQQIRQQIKHIHEQDPEKKRQETKLVIHRGDIVDWLIQRSIRCIRSRKGVGNIHRGASCITGRRGRDRIHKWDRIQKGRIGVHHGGTSIEIRSIHVERRRHRGRKERGRGRGVGGGDGGGDRTRKGTRYRTRDSGGDGTRKGTRKGTRNRTRDGGGDRTRKSGGWKVRRKRNGVGIGLMIKRRRHHGHGRLSHIGIRAFLLLVLHLQSLGSNLEAIHVGNRLICILCIGKGHKAKTFRLSILLVNKHLQP